MISMQWPLSSSLHFSRFCRHCSGCGHSSSGCGGTSGRSSTPSFSHCSKPSCVCRRTGLLNIKPVDCFLGVGRRTRRAAVHEQCMHANAVAMERSCTIPKAKSSEAALHSCWAGMMRCKMMHEKACGVEHSYSSRELLLIRPDGHVIDNIVACMQTSAWQSSPM